MHDKVMGGIYDGLNIIGIKPAMPGFHYAGIIVCWAKLCCPGRLQHILLPAKLFYLFLKPFYLIVQLLFLSLKLFISFFMLVYCLQLFKILFHLFVNIFQFVLYSF